MSKKAKIIIIVIASLLLLVVAYLLIRPGQKQGPIQNTVQNLFPFGQPKSPDTGGTSSSTLGAGSQITPIQDQTTTTNDQSGASGSGFTGTGSQASGSITTSAEQTSYMIPSLSNAQGSATTPQVGTTGTPAATTPTGVSTGPTASPAPTLADRPPVTSSTTTGINCYSRLGNTCFNKIEAAMYYAKQEIAEIDQTITLLRGDASTESVTTKLMKLDQCIPGPDYGYEKRLRELLENNDEWKSIGNNGVSLFDTRKKAGINIEINDVLTNIRTEMSFAAKDIPMTANGLAFVNSTSKYNDLLRDYRDRRTQKVRALASLENLNTQWKTAKASNNTAEQQKITTLFANIGQDLPTQDSWYEAANTHQNIINDVKNINDLQNQCVAQRTQYKTAFTAQKTYIGSKLLQPIRDIVKADEAKKLYCSVDPYAVNSISRNIRGDTLFQFRPSEAPAHGANWDGLWGDSNDVSYDALNNQAAWEDFTVFYYEDQINIHGETLRSLLTRHNAIDLGSIGTVEDEEPYNGYGSSGGGQYYLNDHPQDVLIDDHLPGSGLRSHSLYSFGITCDSFYKSSRFDYADELTLYGF